MQGNGMSAQPQMNFGNGAIVRCQRHPREFVIGICAACLRERLACVDPGDRHTKSFPSSDVKTLDAKISANNKKALQDAKNPPRRKTVISETSSCKGPQLRRSKSFSEGRAVARTNIEEATSLLEPKRKSCEIRVRNTLWSLFQIDHEEAPTKDLEHCSWATGEDIREHVGRVSNHVPGHDDPEPPPPMIYGSFETGESSMNCRTIKAHIDLDAENHIRTQVSENTRSGVEIGKKNPAKESDSKERTRSFWLTAIFRKRIQKWRRRGRCKQHHQQQKHPSRDTRSDILDEARPSFDEEPRFSIDIGRTSWEGSRHSWEEPRASWDGIFVGKIVGREEMAVGPLENQVFREQMKQKCEEEESQSGDPLQAKDYFSDSSLPRRRRTNSVEKPSLVLNPGNDDNSKAVSSETRNITKVSPAIMDDDSKSIPVPTDTKMEETFRGKCSENFRKPYEEMGDSKQVSKSYRWSKALSRTIASPMWGFIQKRSSKEEGGYEGGDIEEGSHSDSWREFQRDKEGRRTLSKDDFFSNGSISSRSWYYSNSSNRHQLVNNGGSSTSNNNTRTNKASWQRNRREELMLDRSRSIHYSPTNADSGLLRFYLTPLRSSRRSIGSTRIRPPHSSFRSTLGLY